MEQMMILAKSHKGKAVELIITKILNSNVYKFSEFLELENIKAVSSSSNQQLGDGNKGV